MSSSETDLGKVLLVDDEYSAHLTLKRLLENQNLAIDSAFSAEEALEKISTDYDLVISDIRMPGMNGVSLLRCIKERLPNIEVLILTGYSSAEDTIVSMTSGAGEYLTKPIEDKNEFITRVFKGIKVARMRSKKPINF
jgi:YesN/AraC family two-component response regulator